MFIKRISYWLSQKLYKKYHNHKRYWYYYRTQCIIFQFTEMSILLGISILLNIVLKTLLIVLGFGLVRSFKSNNHLDNYKKCILLSTSSIIFLSYINTIHNAFFIGIIWGLILNSKLGYFIVKGFNWIWSKGSESYEMVKRFF